MSDKFDWSEQAVLKLRELWDEGLSTAEIGRRLGVSKNAITGKVHRLHLPSRPTPIGGPVRCPAWPALARAIIFDDYPNGFSNEDISKKIKKRCGVDRSPGQIRTQANIWGLKRPRWYLVDMGRRNGRLAAALANSQRRSEPVLVVVTKPTISHQTAQPAKKFPVQRFSMLGGTIRR